MQTEQVASLNSSFCELKRQHELLLSAVAGTPFDPIESSVDQEDSKASSLPPVSEAPKVTDACIQTTDTAFALCAQCTETQLALVDSAQLISRLCDRNMLKSKFFSCDWDTLMKIGRLDVAIWCESLRTDVAALDERSCLLMKSIEDLNLERDKLEESSQTFINKIQDLEIQLTSLKVSSSTTMLH